MSQTGFTPIQLYRTATASAVPSAANLVVGELAINYTDGKLFYEDNLGAVQTIASKDAAAGNFVNLAYTGTLTGGTGVVNIGSGQIYKDATGNLGFGTASPTANLTVAGGTHLRGYTAPNTSFQSLVLGVTGGEGFIQPYTTGLAQIPLNLEGTIVKINTSGVERLRIDSAGNVRLGGTPNAWGSTWKALTLDFYGSLSSTQSDASVNLTANTYNNGTNWIYQESGVAPTLYKGNLGAHTFFTAPSGTAGNPITFTQAMTLTDGGNLLVGGTTDAGAPYRLHLQNTTNSAMRVSAGSDYLDIGQFSDGGFIGTSSSDATLGILRFGTANTERARITSGGYFKASNTGTYANAAASYHEVRSEQNETTLYVSNSSTGSGVNNYLSVLASGAAGKHALYITGAASVYEVLANGNVRNANNSYGPISDLKVKENIVDAPSFLDRFMQLRFVTYNLKESLGYNPEKQLGWIAQEVEQVFPSLVYDNIDTEQVTKTRTVDVPAVLDKDGNEVAPATSREEEYTESVPTGTVTKALKASIISVIQGKVIQEQQAIIEQQATVLSDLLARVSKLESLQ